MLNNLEMDNFAMYIHKTRQMKQMKKKNDYDLFGMSHILKRIKFKLSRFIFAICNIITHVTVILFYLHIAELKK